MGYNAWNQLYMDINKKVLICWSCSFFPNKLDQYTVPAIAIEEHVIRWRCPACGFVNAYPSQLVCLPATNYLQVGPEQLLCPFLTKSINNCYLVVIKTHHAQSIAYRLPANRHLLAQQYGIKTGKLKNMRQISSQSAWASFYKEKREALAKFEQQFKMREELVYANQYRVYLLHEFLKGENKRLKAIEPQGRVKIDVIVLGYLGRFSFKLSTLDLDNEVQNFILILLLGSLDPTSWLCTLYESEVLRYGKNMRKEECYDTLILFVDEKSTKAGVMVIKEPDLKVTNIVTSQSHSNLCQAYEGLPFEKYSIYPLSDASFLNLLEIKSLECPIDEIVVFWSPRRSQTIERALLKPAGHQLADLLLKRNQFGAKIDEDKLKQLLFGHLDSLKVSKLVRLNRLTGSFTRQGSPIKVLYTFNWASIENNLLYSSLEEPTTYADRLLQDVLAAKDATRSPPRPFGKKPAGRLVDLSAEARPESEDDGYISL